MAGLPRSGKSTKARAFKAPIVCPDAIRLALHGERFNDRAETFVWPIAFTMVEALFLAGHDTVVVDACNHTQNRRGQWYERFNHPPDRLVTLEVVPTSEAECIARARAAGDEEIIPVIRRMAGDIDLAIFVNIPQEGGT